MATIRIPPDFSEFLRLLSVHQVRYLLVGGFAVAFHGYPRATLDMDVWIDRAPENAERIVAAFRQFGFDLPDLSADLFLAEGKMIRMGVPPMRIEVATSISGLDFDRCYDARQEVVLDDVPICVISLRDLRRNKLAAGRGKDLLDLENLPTPDP